MRKKRTNNQAYLLRDVVIYWFLEQLKRDQELLAFCEDVKKHEFLEITVDADDLFADSCLVTLSRRAINDREGAKRAISEFNSKARRILKAEGVSPVRQDDFFYVFFNNKAWGDDLLFFGIARFEIFRARFFHKAKVAVL